MAEAILSYLWQALSATLIQILMLLGPGLFLTLILNFETGFIQTRAVNIMGRGWYLGLFGWLGTIIHELGHALFCIIFGHKITDMKLFHPDPQTGTLGYVKHSFNRTNIYQLAGNFFIGIGPVILGTAVIFLLSYFLLGLNPANSNNMSITSSPSGSWDVLKNLAYNTWTASGRQLTEIFSGPHLSGWQLYVFLYLTFAIGTSVTLSLPDIKSAAAGFLIIVILIFAVNLVTIWTGSFLTTLVMRIASYYVLFYTVVFLILLINLAVALFLLAPLSILKGNQPKAKSSER